MSTSGSTSQRNIKHNKYSNLIKQPFIKKLRDSYFDLFSYMDSVVPNFFPLHEVITVWRMLQFIIPCLCAANNLIWDPSNTASTSVSIVSILAHIIPVDYRLNAAVIVEFIYCGINILFFASVIGSSFYYKKTAKLPTYIPIILSVYINTFGYLIHPINMNLIGEDFGRLINGESLHLNLAIEIISIVLSLFCFIMWFWFLDQISVVSLLFRPNSLLSVLGSTQTFIFITTNIVTFLLAIASQLRKYYSAVLTLITAIIYLVGLTSVYTPGSFISSVHKRLVFSCSITSSIFTFIMGIYIIFGRYASFAELFLFVVALVIVYIISYFVLKRSLRKQMKFLDDVHNNTISIDKIERPVLVVKYGITGIQFDHPICINWRIFRLGTDKWPENVKIWVTFAKFVAIYPSENQLLSQIIYTMEANKLKGNLAKQTIQQAKAVYTQRETSLSSNLKSKMNKCTKHVHVTKRKLRHVWDLAIQGSINEMEASINTAYNSVNKARSFYNHLLTQYPNNRFVARSYLHFLIDIECDPKQTSEWTEKVNHLQRGILVNQDRTNLLGIHAFPSLPPTINDTFHHPISAENESFNTETDNNTVDEATQNMQHETTEKMSVIRNNIEKIRIPATSCIKIWNIFIYLVLILLPAIVLMVMLPKYLTDLEDVLFYEYHLSYIRALAIVTPVFANHYLCEQIGFYPQPYYNMVPQAFGFHNQTDKMLQFLLQAILLQVEELNQYSKFKKDHELVKPVNKIIFGGQIPMKNYVSQTIAINSTTTLQGAMSEIVMASTRLLEIINEINCSNNKEECWKLMNTREFLNPYMNFGLISDSITDSLVNMNEFLNQNHTNIQNLIMFICLFVSILYALIIIGILIYQIDSLQKSKITIYKCLTSLPKNVVSTVSESLKIMKNHENENDLDKVEIDTELNKQDENILKIFSSVGDASSMKSLDKTILVACSLFLFICALVITFVIGLSFPEIAVKMNNNSPHMGFILGAAGFGFGAIAALDNLILVSNGHGITGSVDYKYDNPNEDERSVDIRNQMVDYARSSINTFTTYIHNARYGRENGKVGPYSLFESAVISANEDKSGCEDYNSSESAPKYLSCLPIDVQIHTYNVFVQSLITPIGDGFEIDPKPSNEMIQQLWNMMTMGLCNRFLFPIFGGIVPEVQRILDGIIPPTIAIVVIFLILAFFDVLIIIIQILNSEAKLRFALSFLLQCPPSVVMQTQRTMEVLSGQFTSKSKDSSGHDSNFFDQIVECFPDSVIVCNMNYKVLNANKSTERIFGSKIKDVIDQNAREFFTNEQNFKNGEIKELFEKGEGNVETEFKKQGDDGNKCFLNVNLSQMGEQYVIITSDVTQTVLYNTLIAEERVKSDRLLSSILPPNLVKRVQDGEKNISFGVQSATILFLDIVEFTPWCASNTAAIVMSTLNTLFRKFDENLSTHATMTKIKCIGDCYMCSGGIFVEINQPAIHAKETVEFGLEAISSVEENNKDMNMSLRIRVGVNTGGPIVAGVLGTEKPTFEILGPAINMAQQMEHHGVPMKVHISRTTYELIYGGNFVIKERGQVEIKKGSVLTYLVESKK